MAWISAGGNPSSTTLVSCRQRTSGCRSSRKRRMLSRRSRTEFTFQLVTRRRIGGKSADGDLERIDARDETFEHVALDHRGHAFRGAGVDQVAGEQLDQPREVVDGLGDVPDQVGDVAFLADLVIDLQPDLTLVD